MQRGWVLNRWVVGMDSSACEERGGWVDGVFPFLCFLCDLRLILRWEIPTMYGILNC